MWSELNAKLVVCQPDRHMKVSPDCLNQGFRWLKLWLPASLPASLVKYLVWSDCRTLFRNTVKVVLL